MCIFCDWESAEEQADEILGRLEDLPERAEGFVANAQETVSGIQTWIQENEHVTDAQVTALENIDAAIDRWGEDGA